MRLWTLHPRYLDAKGLVAAWREALLAQKVLADGTKGYRQQPQLVRFQAQAAPLATTATGSLQVLLQHKVFRSATYWQERATAGRKCGGENVRTVIRNFVQAAE